MVLSVSPRPSVTWRWSFYDPQRRLPLAPCARSRRRESGEDAVRVPCGVIPFELFALVILPVGVPIAARSQRPEPQDRFRAGEAPPRPGEREAIADEMATGAFNDTRGNGDPPFEIVVVAEQGAMALQIVGAAVGRAAHRPPQPATRGRAANRGHHLAHIPAEQPEQPLGHPRFGLRRPLGMEDVRGLPEVLQDVDQVEDDGDRHAEPLRGGPHAAHLIDLAIDEPPPPLLPLRLPRPGP